MLRKLRITVAILVFCLLTFYFLDFAEVLPIEFHVLGHIQFIPALMSGSIAIIAGLIICTLLFGRIYCSTICPLGFLQDIIGRKTRNLSLPKLRWSIVAACFICFFSGFTVVVGILDPFSAYGRIAVHLFKPVYMFINNVLGISYKVEIVMFSIFSLVVAALTVIIIIALKGRTYCNTICPVGTILGFLSKYSLFKIRINGDCASCGICEKKCKASCIDAKNKTIDYSRCVNCFNCINNCNKKGISFSMLRKTEVDKSKRKFLLTGLAVAAVAPSAFAQSRSAISPPGAISAQRLLKTCTSCHLCVSKCPSKVLKPAFMEYGAGGIMQPVMSFEKGFCNFDCTICANICPSNALTPLTKEQKHRLQVGKVVFIPDLCVVHTDGTSCGACSEHCPTQAVKMIPYKNGLTEPFIDVDICVGCGGCEYICPVRPKRAIYVEGNKVHQQAKAFEVEQKEEKEITDFGF